MQIVIINGYPGSGKTTFIQQLQKKYNFIENFSSIDYIKNFMKYNLYWDGKKTPKSRKLMSILKEAFEDYNNSITKDLFRKIEAEHQKEFFENNYNNETDFGETIVFVDIREPKNITRFIKSCIGYFRIVPITIFINREKCRSDIQSNESDSNVEDYTYDFYIDNNGTLEDLKNAGTNFCNTITLM